MKFDMMKRFFAYGCSFTKWDYPTWADFIGVNFTEYYNRGRGGCDHTYMADLIFSDHLKFQFNPQTDLIFLCSTGFNRLTWFDKKGYNCVGDLYNWQNSIKQAGIHDHKKLDGFFETIWNLDWAFLRSCESIIQVKTFLDSLQIQSVFFEGVASKFILEKDFGLTTYTQDKLQHFFNLLQPITSLDRFRCDYETHAYNDGMIDGHPGQPRHYSYVKTYFPHLITEKSQSFYNDTIDSYFLKQYQSKKQRRESYRSYLKDKYLNMKYNIDSPKEQNE